MEDYQAAEEVTAGSATGRRRQGPRPGGRRQPRACVGRWAAYGRGQRPSPRAGWRRPAVTLARPGVVNLRGRGDRGDQGSPRGTPGAPHTPPRLRPLPRGAGSRAARSFESPAQTLPRDALPSRAGDRPRARLLGGAAS